MQGILFILYVLLMSGALAALGDWLGYRLGKMRLSVFNLRPRHTATAMTIVTGLLIASSSVGVLLLFNRSLADALFRYSQQVNTYQEQIQTLETDIGGLQGELEQLKTQEQEAQAQIGELKTQRQQLIQERDRLQQQRDDTEVRLTETNRRLAAKGRELAQAQQQTARVQAEVLNARYQVSQLQGEREQLQQSLQESQQSLETLQAQKQQLRDEIDDLTTVSRRLRGGEFAVLAGESLATGVIEGGLSPANIQQGLNGLLARTEQRARQLGAQPLPNEQRAVLIPVREVNRLIQAVSPPGRWVVQVFAINNSLVGEPVPVITGVIPNRLLFPQGTILSEAEIPPGQTETELEESIKRLFVLAGQRSRDAGILTDAGNEVGEFSSARLFDLVRQLQDSERPVQVQVVTAENIYTAGPLKVNLLALDDEEQQQPQPAQRGTDRLQADNS
jgi:uncharacterized protein (DUF3084 family)